MTNPTLHQSAAQVPGTIPDKGFDPDDAQIPDNQDGVLSDPADEQANDDEEIVGPDDERG